MPSLKPQASVFSAEKGPLFLDDFEGRASGLGLGLHDTAKLLWRCGTESWVCAVLSLKARSSSKFERQSLLRVPWTCQSESPARPARTRAQRATRCQSHLKVFMGSSDSWSDALLSFSFRAHIMITPTLPPRPPTGMARNRALSVVLEIALSHDAQLHCGAFGVLLVCMQVILCSIGRLPSACF